MVSQQLSVAESPTPELPLRSLGKYQLLELIGSGAMGDVYRAEHVLLGRRVAVKVLRKELARERSVVERFFSEARAVNLVGHPHIVEVTDFAREPDGTVWFVMEFLEGKDLGTLLRDERPSLRRSLEIARQISDALDAVHGVDIIHRDIKPENVFLVQREGRDFVKLLDFGIARLPELRENEHPTLRGVVMGTPPYMAPEQARGLEVDHRSDVYSVGAVLFELITGRAVFEQQTLHAVLSDIALKAPPRLSDHAQLPSCVRGELDALLARCLAKDPDQRPASAKALAGELSAIAARLEAWAMDPTPDEPALARLTLVSDEREHSARESAELLAGCRPKWPARALWLGAALATAGAAIWLGPVTNATQAASAQAGVTQASTETAVVRAEPSAPPAASHFVTVIQPAAGATLVPSAHPLPARSREVEAEPVAEPRTRRERRREEAPSSAAPSTDDARRAAAAAEAQEVSKLALAAAADARELDPHKLLDPFAGE
jgi:eukaryotic-like serine/threonine-protein kinase